MYIYIFANTQAHTRTRARTHTHTHARTHARTRTHTQREREIERERERERESAEETDGVVITEEGKSAIIKVDEDAKGVARNELLAAALHARPMRPDLAGRTVAPAVELAPGHALVGLVCRAAGDTDEHEGRRGQVLDSDFEVMHAVPEGLCADDGGVAARGVVGGQEVVLREDHLTVALFGVPALRGVGHGR